MKLIRDEKIVKLPKVKGGVTRTLADARLTSCEKAWDKVIVIGSSRETGSFYTSSMSVNDAVAMLERVKHDLLNL